MQRSIRASAAVLATGLVLIACGTASDTDSGAAPSTEPATAPGAEPALAPTETPAPAGATPDSRPTAGVATEEPVESDPAPAIAEPAATEAPAQTEAVLGGRAFASELASESDFAENMLPDLLVDDIRGGQKVNIRNVFPAERPVLMWMWAPH
jgi:hypothetical protein